MGVTLTPSFATRLARLAGDRRHSSDAVENLAAYVLHGGNEERVLAVQALAQLRELSTLPVLLMVLQQCDDILRNRSSAAGLPGLSEAPLRLAGELCDALAKFDCGTAHEELVGWCNRPGYIFLRASAIRATGFECNWHDESLIHRYLAPGNCTTFRVAATIAIFNTGGHRLAKYKPFVKPLLADASPYVTLSAVDVLALLIAYDDEILRAFSQLRDDHRYCKFYRTTVARYVATYFSD